MYEDENNGKVLHLYHIHHPLKTEFVQGAVHTAVWGGSLSCSKCLSLNIVLYFSLKTLQLHWHFLEKKKMFLAQDKKG